MKGSERVLRHIQIVADERLRNGKDVFKNVISGGDGSGDAVDAQRNTGEGEMFRGVSTAIAHRPLPGIQDQVGAGDMGSVALGGDDGDRVVERRLVSSASQAERDPVKATASRAGASLIVLEVAMASPRHQDSEAHLPPMNDGLPDWQTYLTRKLPGLYLHP